jgi:hypothetical protein
LEEKALSWNRKNCQGNRGVDKGILRILVCFYKYRLLPGVWMQSGAI